MAVDEFGNVIPDDGTGTTTGGETGGDPTNVVSDSYSTPEEKAVAKIGNQFDQVAQSTNSNVDFKDYDQELVKDKLDSTVSFQDPKNYIDKQTDTVAGQMEKLLSSDNPYVKLQQDKAVETMAGRGLMNTQLGQQAGLRTATESAFDIAKADAATYAAFSKSKQDAEYGVQTIQSEAIVSGEMVEQKANIERTNTDINNAFTAQMSAATDESKVWLGELQQSYNVSIQNLDSLTKQAMQSNELDAMQGANVADQSAAIMQNYQVSVENMMTDPDFLQLGSAAVNKAINQLQNLAANSINLIGASQNIDMSPWVDQYLNNLEVL